MDFKLGYKDSEVGIIPENWQVRPLLSAVRIANGQVDPKIEPYKSMILIAPDHIESTTGRLLGQQTAKEQRAISGKYFFQKGDIVYTKIRPYLRKAILAEFDGLCSADMYPLKPTNGVSAAFMIAVLLGHRFSKYAESVSLRSGMPKINRAELAAYNFALPPHVEQEAISSALVDADALIKSLEQAIDKKRLIKQGAMQELLRPKRTWIVKCLGDIAHIKTGGRNNKDKSDDGEYPFFVRSSIIERINSYSYDCEAILIPGEGRIGNIFHYVAGRFDVHQRVYAITRFDPAVSGKYVYYYVVNHFGRHATQNSVKATVDSLRLPTFTQFEIGMPSTIVEQKVIAKTLSAMDEEIAALERKLSKFRRLKLGMMHNLLAGKIRLL